MRALAGLIVVVAIFLTWELPAHALPDPNPPANEASNGPRYAVDRQFREVLSLRTSVSNQHDTIRNVLQKLSLSRGLSIVLDPRIDPTQRIPLSLANAPVSDVLNKIAARLNAVCVYVGNTAYIGPRPTANRLRTLVALRNENVDSLSKLSRSRRLDLRTDTTTVQWADLAEPRTLIQDFARRQNITIRNPDEIPHDLWSRGTLPDVTINEGLTLLLAPFQLTFRWEDPGTAIELVPFPQQVGITKTYRAKTRTPVADRNGRAIVAMKEWQLRFPHLKNLRQNSRGQIEVTATVEQHELLDNYLNPSRVKQPQPPRGIVPISRREFTLKIENVPVSAVMKKLEDSGIRFEFNNEVLMAANVELDQRISIHADKASGDEFFKSLFDPLGLNFAIEGVTVKLRPKP